MIQNLSTDPQAVAAYDESGSWGRLSEGWPETPYTPAKWLLCTKAEIVPYGQYVVVGAKHTPQAWWDYSPRPDGNYDYSEAVIRVASEDLKARLEKVYDEMFVICRRFIEQELSWPQ